MHIPPRILSDRRGFTLVELLAVIVIIAVLTTLLLVGYKNFVERSLGIQCLNNLKYLQRASEMWSQDNNGLMLPGGDAQGRGWPQILAPNTDYKYVRCPGWMRKYHWPYPGETSIYTSYPTTGYNRSSYLASDPNRYYFSPPGRELQIPHPSRTVSFCDCDSRLAGDMYSAGFPVDGGGPFYYYLYPAHGNGFNLIFFDGHAEWAAFNANGPYEGHGAGDYPQFIWKPY